MTLTRAEKEAADRADAVRQEYGYGKAPIANIQDIIETIDPQALVAVLEMPEGLDGIVLKDPRRGRFVVGIATTSVPERQRFSLAHELGHIVFEDYKAGIPSDCSARTPAEIRADTFARHLLAPLDGIQNLLAERGVDGRDLELGDLASVVRHFGVSPPVARIQLKLLGLLSRERETEWTGHTGRGLAAAFGHLNEYQAEAARTRVPVPPQNLVYRATRAYKQNALAIGALARLAGEDVDEMKSALTEAGLVPTEPPSLEVDDDEFFGGRG